MPRTRPLPAMLSLALAGAAVAQAPATRPEAPAAAEASPEGAEGAATRTSTEAAPPEVVRVTGSRLERLAQPGAAPLIVLTREQLLASGQVNLGEFLQTLPMQGGAVNAQINLGNDGRVNVALRSLGAGRTLVLLDGRRFVPGGAGADQAVDLNTLPVAAVERIEVLLDGASSLYGSGAIAGVVNVVTRRRLDATEVTAYAGQSSRGDATTYDLAAITGTGSEKGHLLFSIGYQRQEPIYAGDRDWSRQTYRWDFQSGQEISIEGNSGTTPDGRFTLPAGTCSSVDPLDLAKVAACSGVTDPAVANQLIPNGDGTFRVGTELYNTHPDDYLYTPSQRIQLFSAGDARLAPWARAFFEATYVNRTSAQQQAATPLAMNFGNDPVSADSIYNPFGVDLGTWRRRTTEFGPRTTSQEFDTFQVVLGLDGALGGWAGPLRGWRWEASYTYGRTAGVEVSDGLLRSDRIGTAVGPSFLHPVQGPVCGDVGLDGIAGTSDDRVVYGCVPMDVLGGQGSLTPEMKGYVGFQGVAHGWSRLEVAAVSFGGDLLHLWSNRPAGLLAGVEYHRDAGGYLPDPLSAGGSSTGSLERAVEGAYEALEGYAELLTPILNGVAGVHDLELSLAARLFRYSSFGADSTWQVGLRYAPVRDVVLRGGYATAFRAPDIGELYTSGSYVSYDFTPGGDPCFELSTSDPAVAARCAADGVPPGGSGDPGLHFATSKSANPALEPERAEVLTLGAVLTPRWVPDLTVTLGYTRIDLTGTPGDLGSHTILQGCYLQGVQARCDAVHRDAAGIIQRIDDPLQNAGATSTAALDVGARYVLSTAEAGRFGVLFDGTFLQYYDRTQADGSVIEGKGNYDLGLLPSFKGNASLDWSRRGLSAGLTGRYVGAFKECESTVCSLDDSASRTVSPYLTADAYVGYAMKTAAGATSLTVGVRNLLDAQPPRIYGGYSYSTDPDYAFPGRFFHGRVTQRF